MTEYHDTKEGCDIMFSIDDEDYPITVHAWVEAIPGANIEEKTAAMELAIERQTGRRYKLLCRMARKSDYRFEVLSGS